MSWSKNIVLAFDTSNYTTSVAAIDEQRTVILDIRKGLEVKSGERGLRQSEALFQHIKNLPGMVEQVFQQIDPASLCAVAVSNKPRPVDGSYMPVFLGGEGYARTIASARNIPLSFFSHQEGHLEAAKYGTSLECECTPFFAYHLSGGTCELLFVTDTAIEIIGGTKDISFGQLLDRAGVAAGYSFPAGSALDAIAQTEKCISEETEKNPFKPIALDGLYFNVSGLESQFMRLLDSASGEAERNRLIYWLFETISDCLIRLTILASRERNYRHVLFSGGVSSSIFVRNRLEEKLSDFHIDPVFGDPHLSSDNAVGIALLGGRKQWR